MLPSAPPPPPMASARGSTSPAEAGPSALFRPGEARDGPAPVVAAARGPQQQQQRSSFLAQPLVPEAVPVPSSPAAAWQQRARTRQ